MTFKLEVGKKYRTRDGSEAEVYGEHDGIFYGRIGFAVATWSVDGTCRDGACGRRLGGDILPPAPVKKWLWVLERKGGLLSLQDRYQISHHFYASAEEADTNCPAWTAITRIEGSEVEE